jgi:hypothetical protein
MSSVEQKQEETHTEKGNDFGPTTYVDGELGGE